MNYDELALEQHKAHKGKITTKLRDESEVTREKLSTYYTPGVAAVTKLCTENQDVLSP